MNQNLTVLGVVVHTCNPRNVAGDGTETGDVGVQGHPWICSEFEASQDYIKPYIKTVTAERQNPNQPTIQTKASNKNWGRIDNYFKNINIKYKF